MLKYIAALQQDVCDFGFDTARGAHALILTNIKESHCSWLDIELIQGMRQSYTYKIQAESTGKTMTMELTGITRVMLIALHVFAGISIRDPALTPVLT